MPISTDEADAIAATMVIKHYKKGDVLLKEGQISTEAYFVLEGCVRQYYIVDGEERTANFFSEEQWVISLNSFSNNLPSNHNMACSTDCFLVVGNREKEEDLYLPVCKNCNLSNIVIRGNIKNKNKYGFEKNGINCT